MFIPGLVETDQLNEIAKTLKDVDPGIPFTILAFFPEHQMMDYRSPTVVEMVDAYEAAKATGLHNIRLGNVGLFAKTERDQEYLMAHVDRGAY